MFGMSGEASEAKEPVLFLVRNRRWSKESVEERELLVWDRWGEETGSVVGEVVLIGTAPKRWSGDGWGGSIFSIGF